MAKAMRKMHTPAYCPVLLGVKELAQRGVSVAVKNTTSICMLVEEDIVVELLSVDVGMAIAVVLEPMSISILLAGCNDDNEEEMIE